MLRFPPVPQFIKDLEGHAWLWWQTMVWIVIAMGLVVLVGTLLGY